MGSHVVALGKSVKGTRGEIVELLQRHGEMTVQALVEELSVAPPALRRHLDILAAEGTVEFRAVKQATGRPRYVFRLTEAAHEKLSTGYPRLMERFIEEAASLPVRSRTGTAVLDALFDGISDRLVDAHRSQVRGDSMKARIECVTSALREEGILEDWSEKPDGYHLYNGNCPYHRAARASSGRCCASEQRAIALLLDAPVEQIGRIAEGEPVCEYIVRPVS
jgi:DeoR family transcriptional regulator, suf operon transcriptional repressor